MSNQVQFIRQTAAVLMACGLIASLLPGPAAEGTWSDEEIVEPDWDQEMDSWWGPRRVINLTPGGHALYGSHGSYVALVEIAD